MKLSAPTDKKRCPETTETRVTQVSSGQLAGGKPTGTGTFFEPTVLVDVDQSMSCMTEETLGPPSPW
jgi:acyl-CoA reductase-like NAD-dependent aldehyde dehydrogenase